MWMYYHYLSLSKTIQTRNFLVNWIFCLPEIVDVERGHIPPPPFDDPLAWGCLQRLRFKLKGNDDVMQSYVKLGSYLQNKWTCEGQ